MKLAAAMLFALCATVALFELFASAIGYSRLVNDGVLTLSLLVCLAGLYFTPTTIAYSRRHRNALPIAVVNAAFGWSGIGWVGCLAWALWSDGGR